MRSILLIIFFLISFLLIGVIILQKNKSTDIGGNSFNVGASTTLFGSSGSNNFMIKITSILATLFFSISLIFGNITNNSKEKDKNTNEISEKKQDLDKSLNQLPSSHNDIPIE